MARPHGLTSTCLLPLFLLLLAAPRAALALEASFEVYPEEAQPCLYAAAKSSKCSGDTVVELNGCLCSGGAPDSSSYGFMYGSALCLGPRVSADVVSDVYDTMQSSCAPSRTPLRYDKKSYLSWAAEEAAKSTSTSSSTTSSSTTTTDKTTPSSSSSTTMATTTSASVTTATATASPGASSTASATASSTASPTPAADDNSKKLSTPATIGIAAGASVAGLAALAGLAFFLICRRRRNAVDSTTFTFLHPNPSPDFDGDVFAAAPHEAKSHYSASTYGSSPPPQPQQQQQQQQQNAAGMPFARQGPQPQNEQQGAQPNFLAAWKPPASAPYSDSPSPNNGQVSGPYEAPAAPAQPRTKPLSGIFELDSHGSDAVPQEHQSGWQPVPQQPDPPRNYRPYMPQ